MNLTPNHTGFSLASKGVTFVFPEGALPVPDGGLCSLLIESGAIPVPALLPTDRLILPVDEGMVIEVGRKYDRGELNIDDIGGDFCGRSGTMSLILVQRAGKFLLICLDSGIDASYHALYADGQYALSMSCRAPRTVTYGIFDTLPAACRAYQAIKRLHPIPLTEKLRITPEAEKLVGGGIFWVWNDHYDEVMYAPTDTDISPVVGDALLDVAQQLKDGGVDKALFGLFFNGDSPATKPLYERFGYIATQYDNYNDVLNPAMLSIIPNNRAKNCDYTHRRMADYPAGVQIDENGDMAKAWALRGFDGNMYHQNTLCPLVAAQRIREEIPEILREYPFYKGRFIDVYGGGLSACHSAEHPLTKEECLAVKQGAFLFLGDIGLIAGTEDGFENIVDSLVYTEGLHSPVYFRNEDSGRAHAHYYPPERDAHIHKYMLDPACRVPLWQLIYHDCLLAFPYWGDSTESSLTGLREKVLFACLYGCPPLYSFFMKDFPLLKDAILQSYREIAAVLEKTALLPMTDYQVLTDDSQLQRTVFGGRYEVVANFADSPAQWQGRAIAPLSLYFGEL